MKFKFYILFEDSQVLGTNNRATAEQAAGSDTTIVLDVEEGTQLIGDNLEEQIEEAK